MKRKMMLKKCATETDPRIRDRMMPTIKVKYDAMGIRDAAKSIEKPDSWGTNGATGTHRWALTNWQTSRTPAGRPRRVGQP